MDDILQNAQKFAAFTSEFDVGQIFKNTDLTNADKTYIHSKLERIEISKGSHLLKLDSRVYHQYYVVSGCLRTYFTDSLAKEHTIQFAIHDWWISDYTAYFSATTASLEIESLQDSILYKLSKTNMDLLCSKIPKIETFFRKKMEGAFATFQKRIVSNLSQSAQERYLDFTATYPIIEQNIKNYHIASYLGITTESLSRIRKKLSEH